MADQAYFDELERLSGHLDFLESRNVDESTTSDERTRNTEQIESLKARTSQIMDAGFVGSGADKLRQLGQGLTFEFGDEIEAGVRAPFSDSGYGEIRDEIRDKNAVYKKAYPNDAMVLNALGGFAPVTKAFNAIGTGGSLGSNLLKQTGMGLGLGALHGVGKSESETYGGVLADTVKPAIEGGGISAAISTIPIIGKYGTQAWRKVTKEAPDRADEIIGEIIRSTGKTERQVKDELESLGAEGTLADLDQSTLALLMASTQKSAPARQLADDIYSPRQQQSPERIIGALEDATGFKVGDYRTIARPPLLGAGDDMIDQGGLIAKQRTLQDERAYGELNKESVPLNHNIRSVLQHEKARPEVSKVLQDMNIPADAMDDILQNNKVPFTLLNGIKIHFDELIGQAQDKGKANQARIWTDLKTKLTDETDKLVPNYPIARADSAELAGQIDAGTQGRKLMSTRGEKLQNQELKFNAYTPQEKETFRMGALDDAAEKVHMGMGKKGTGYAAGAIRSPFDPQRQARVGMLAGDKTDVVNDIMDRESNFYRTFGMTNPETGSRTALIQGAETIGDDAASLSGAVLDAMRGDIPALVRAFESKSGMSTEVATAIAKKLTSQTLTGADVNRLMNTYTLDETTLDLINRLRKTTATTKGALLPAELSEDEKEGALAR